MNADDHSRLRGRACMARMDIDGDKIARVWGETGGVVLAEASVKEWKEISRFTLTPQSKQRAKQGKVWTVPGVSNGRLYLRGQEHLFRFDLNPVGAVVPLRSDRDRILASSIYFIAMNASHQQSQRKKSP